MAKSFKLFKYDEVTSTNDVARELGKVSCDEQLVVVANRQTAGRGRRGRAFYSPQNSGIYMSMLVPVGQTENETLSFTAKAAVCAALAIEKNSGKQTAIKWVNDIYMSNSKVAGILAEGVADDSTGTVTSVIIGIGINCQRPEKGFPQELENIAGEVFDKEEEFSKDRIIEDILSNWEEISKESIYNEYVQRDYLKGKTIKVINAGREQFEAVAEGISDDFGLIIKSEKNGQDFLHSGEVTIRYEHNKKF
ncbi:MAG: biotin--[acetyl-CoA-carboxylase] ligase [Clostridiales bacterium]|jgi:BirA family biotin operon repressor/biotin-[acetyl-CoA-carboxylase] ligase|nr:biotin--[acetyl-CoA-carboxylase] ligase [Clostridiales bacterium]